MERSSAGSAAILAAVAAAPLPARAAGGELSLDTFAGVRSYLDESPWLTTRQTLYEETLQAALDSYLLDRALARYHVGFALDWRTYETESQVTRLLDTRYDATLDFWRDGTVPVLLTANRQVLDAFQAEVPTYRVVSSQVGGSAAVVSRWLPRIQAQGYLQELATEGIEQEPRLLRTSDVRGEVIHVRNRLVATARVEDRRIDRPTEDRATDLRLTDLYAQYRLDEDLDLLGRAYSRTYVTRAGDEETRLDMETVNGQARWEPDPATQGNLFYQLQRGAWEGGESGDATLGTYWFWRIGSSATLGAQAGVSDSYQGQDGEITRYIGRFANAYGSRTLSSRGSRLQVWGQGGAAAVTEAGGEGGTQLGTSAGAIAEQSVAAHLLRVTLGGRLARHWDTSPRDLDYRGWGWSTSVSTRQLRGVSFSFAAQRDAIVQLSSDEGNNDRFRAIALAQWRVLERLEAGYALVAYDDRLDEEHATGIAHSFRVNARPIPPLSLSAIYMRSGYDSEDLPELWTRRLDVLALYSIPLINLEFRVTDAWEGGRVEERHHRAVWVEASRRFSWGF